MITEEFIGKCLIRKSKTSDGKMKIVICGIFEPSGIDQSVENYHNNDEMWAVRLKVDEVIKHKDCTYKALSPEEFLQGKAMNPKDWKISEKKITY